MHGVNLDLLQTTPHRADGTARDPHAWHAAEHRAALRDARRAWWRNRLPAVLRLLGLVLARPLSRASFLHKYPGVRGKAPGAVPGAAVSRSRP